MNWSLQIMNLWNLVNQTFFCSFYQVWRWYSHEPLETPWALTELWRNDQIIGLTWCLKILILHFEGLLMVYLLLDEPDQQQTVTDMVRWRKLSSTSTHIKTRSDDRTGKYYQHFIRIIKCFYVSYSPSL